MAARSLCVRACGRGLCAWCVRAYGCVGARAFACLRAFVHGCASACTFAACVPSCACVQCMRACVHACVCVPPCARARLRAYARWECCAACVRAACVVRAYVCVRACACAYVPACARSWLRVCARAQARVLDVVRRHAVRPGPAANAGSFVADGWPHAGANAGPETKTCARAPTLHIARAHERTNGHARSLAHMHGRAGSRASARITSLPPSRDPSGLLNTGSFPFCHYCWC